MIQNHIIQNYPWLNQSYKLFDQYLQSKRIPKGIIIYGEERLAKTQLAYLIAQSLLCQNSTNRPCFKCIDCLQIKDKTNPKLIFVGLETNSKQIKLHHDKNKDEKQIQIAEMISLFTFSETHHKVAIIDPADLLNISAANALLKTLEELGENKTIIFVTSRLHQLPKTIISRCEKIFVRFHDCLDSQKWWLKQTKQTDLSQKEKNKAIEQYHFLLKICHQKIFNALSYKEKINLIVDFWQLLSALLTDQISVHNLVKQISKWDKTFIIAIFISLIQLFIYHKALNLAHSKNNTNPVKKQIFSLINDGKLESHQKWVNNLIEKLSIVDFELLNLFYQDLEKTLRLLKSQANELLVLENLLTLFQYLPQVKKYPDIFKFNQIETI